GKLSYHDRPASSPRKFSCQPFHGNSLRELNDPACFVDRASHQALFHRAAPVLLSLRNDGRSCIHLEESKRWGAAIEHSFQARDSKGWIRVSEVGSRKLIQDEWN